MKRRSFLKSLAVASCGLTGCLHSEEENKRDVVSGEFMQGKQKVLDYELDRLAESDIEVLRKDGIPSIDSPSYTDSYSNNFSDNIVFGVNINGDKKAFPRLILAQHEIVNDTIGGENISVTYCPLTGTAVGFFRGDTELGVSGHLLNNNLVMYDRASESFWSQMLGVSFEGSNRGEFLEEFDVVWTTWDRWSQKHPDTEVLSTNTGYARNYSNGVYGSYNPRSSYYELSSDTLYSNLNSSDRFRKKVKVLGSRTSTSSYCVEFDRLRSEKIVSNEDVVAVYDEELDTGYMYKNSKDISYDDDLVVNGEKQPVDNPDLERVRGYEAMWFAWYAMYPNTEVI